MVVIIVVLLVMSSINDFYFATQIEANEIALLVMSSIWNKDLWMMMMIKVVEIIYEHLLWCMKVRLCTVYL